MPRKKNAEIQAKKAPNNTYKHDAKKIFIHKFEPKKNT